MTHADFERGSGSGCLAWVLATAPGQVPQWRMVVKRGAFVSLPPVSCVASW